MVHVRIMKQRLLQPRGLPGRFGLRGVCRQRQADQQFGPVRGREKLPLHKGGAIRGHDQQAERRSQRYQPVTQGQQQQAVITAPEPARRLVFMRMTQLCR